MKDRLKMLLGIVVKVTFSIVFLLATRNSAYYIGSKIFNKTGATIVSILFSLAGVFVLLYELSLGDITGVGLGGYCPGCENCEHHDECREFYEEYATEEKEKVDLEKDELKEVHNE